MNESILSDSILWSKVGFLVRMLAAAGTSGRVEHMDMQQQPFPLTKWWVRGHDTTTLLCVLEKKKKRLLLKSPGYVKIWVPILGMGAQSPCERTEVGN